MPQNKFSTLHYKKSYLYTKCYILNLVLPDKCSIKKPIFKIELSHKIPLLQKKEYFSTKMLNSKNALSQKYTQPQKRTFEILQKKIPKKKIKKNSKKISPKKIQKKIEERLPRFSRSQIGGVEGVHIPTQRSLRAYTLT